MVGSSKSALISDSVCRGGHRGSAGRSRAQTMIYQGAAKGPARSGSARAGPAPCPAPAAPALRPPRHRLPLQNTSAHLEEGGVEHPDGARNVPPQPLHLLRPRVHHLHGRLEVLQRRRRRRARARQRGAGAGGRQRGCRGQRKPEKGGEVRAGTQAMVASPRRRAWRQRRTQWQQLCVPHPRATPLTPAPLGDDRQVAPHPSQLPLQRLEVGGGVFHLQAAHAGNKGGLLPCRRCGGGAPGPPRAARAALPCGLALCPPAVFPAAPPQHPPGRRRLARCPTGAKRWCLWR